MPGENLGVRSNTRASPGTYAPILRVLVLSLPLYYYPLVLFLLHVDSPFSLQVKLGGLKKRILDIQNARSTRSVWILLETSRQLVEEALDTMSVVLSASEAASLPDSPRINLSGMPLSVKSVFVPPI